MKYRLYCIDNSLRPVFYGLSINYIRLSRLSFFLKLIILHERFKQWNKKHIGMHGNISGRTIRRRLSGCIHLDFHNCHFCQTGLEAIKWCQWSVTTLNQNWSRGEKDWIGIIKQIRRCSKTSSIATIIGVSYRTIQSEGCKIIFSFLNSAYFDTGLPANNFIIFIQNWMIKLCFDQGKSLVSSVL